jgi:hypothetical protein
MTRDAYGYAFTVNEGVFLVDVYKPLDRSVAWLIVDRATQTEHLFKRYHDYEFYMRQQVNSHRVY